jgi:hypothetical protein
LLFLIATVENEQGRSKDLPCFMRYSIIVLFALSCSAEDLPVLEKVERQPLAANVTRVLQALDTLGEPLISDADWARLAKADAREIQRILDPYALVGVHINPENRVKVQQGPAKPELIEQGWRTFLVKVQNEAGVTAVLAVDSPNAGSVANRPSEAWNRRFLDIQLHHKQPMKPHLSGLEVEYAILQMYMRDNGRREAKLVFDVGQGSQDLGFRNEVDILFTAKPATTVTFRVLDSDDRPATASFLVRDSKGRVYPSQAKRQAPDFFFHPQVYRADGEHLVLPAGDYTVEYQRGPEYRKRTQQLRVADKPLEVVFRLERWIDPAKLGWFSGDHHIHAAGCSHYEKPSEGVYPKDMMRHILGEDLKLGSVLTWGPGWYFQKTFFDGKDHPLSTRDNLMRYDIEVSGFPSSHTGHLILLGVKEQDYPGTRRIEDWPSWGIPVPQWGRSQGAVNGYAHSGWGLQVKNEKLLSDEIPPFDGIGANEYIVSVTQGLVDFISAVDTPYAWELNVWYHTLNAGYRTRISGETDFPCIYDEKVGLGRSYVRQAKLDFADWIQGVREGRNYVSDGKSHIIDFAVNGLAMGDAGSEVKLPSAGRVKVTAKVAALLNEAADSAIRGLRYDEKPYWDVERARISGTRRVPVELIVNGVAVARKEIEGDGSLQNVSFDYKVTGSAWIALRILPSSHTNPIFAIVNDRPIRIRSSLEWCLKAVEQCRSRKIERMRLEDRAPATRSYDFAVSEYRKRLGETVR